MIIKFVPWLLICSVQEDVLAPPPENDDVINDFDIEEEVIEVENRLDILMYIWLKSLGINWENVTVFL